LALQQTGILEWGMKKERERDSWMFYEDHLADEEGKAGKRCKCG